MNIAVLGIADDSRKRLSLLKDDGTVQLRDLRSKEEQYLQDNPGKVIDMSLSPDKKVLATVDEN